MIAFLIMYILFYLFSFINILDTTYNMTSYKIDNLSRKRGPGYEQVKIMASIIKVEYFKFLKISIEDL